MKQKKKKGTTQWKQQTVIHTCGSEEKMDMGTVSFRREVRHSFAVAPKVSHIPLFLPSKYTEHSTTTFVDCPWQRKSGGGGESPPPQTTKQRHAFGPGCESRRRKRLRGACDNEIGRQTVKKRKQRLRETTIHTHNAHTCAQHSSSVKEGESFHVPDLAFAVFSPGQSAARFGQKGLRAQHNLPTFR